MRVFLIRHGTPDFGPYRDAMIGTTDLALSDQGAREIRKTARWLADESGAEIIPDAGNPRIYTSPLRRARESAGIVAEVFGINPAEIRTIPEFQEICLGTWDGENRQVIREKYPVEFRKRRENLGTYRTPGGETFAEVRDRALRGLTEITGENTNTDAIIVAHAGTIRALLCGISGKNLNDLFDWPCPTAGVTGLSTFGDGKGFRIDFAGVRPVSLLTGEEIAGLCEKYGTPEDVRAHMRAVRERCDEILDATQDARGWNADDRKILDAAALTHDLLRTRPHHAEAGAEVLRKAGYPAVADLVRQHHSEEDATAGPVTLGEILCYADETTAGTRRVTLEERFGKSREKCRTDEAVRHHDRRYRRALAIERKI